MPLALLLLALPACVVPGCAAPAVEPSYRDPTPEAQLDAIRQSAQRKDMQDVPALVECLWSDDPAVRMAAIEALKRITGTTLDYRAAATPSERAPAVERWKAWVREHHLLPAAPTGSQ